MKRDLMNKFLFTLPTFNYCKQCCTEYICAYMVLLFCNYVVKENSLRHDCWVQGIHSYLLF
jgi:hypothetical protein